MRLSNGFWQTFKEVPADAEVPSHQLMLRAGLMHKSGAGLYNYLPMGYRSIRKVEAIVREELDRINCHELLMTVVTPGELWKETGRWHKNEQMLKFQDKGERDVCISPTNEEAVADIFRKYVKSYKELPLTLYQINTKFRDEIRPRFGLLRAREFIMKDAYSFHVDKACLDKIYADLFTAYGRIIDRLGLEYMAVEADAGDMADGDSQTHEFQVLAGTGEDDIIFSDKEGYAANVERAETVRSDVNFSLNQANLEEVKTPGKASIEDVANFLKVPECQCLKALLYESVKDDEGKFVLALLLGDDVLNEIKLKNYLAGDHLRPATDKQMAQLGIEKGFIGPSNLPESVEVLIDKAVDQKAFFVVGAQKKDFHQQGFNPQRDLKEQTVVDLRMSKAGDVTLKGNVVEVKKGIEVGHIFQLGDYYTQKMGITVLDANGKQVTPLMGCYGIGVTRMVAAAIEQCHDDKGIVWPVQIAPYQIYLAFIGKSDEIKKATDEAYQQLKEAGIEVLYDDRGKSPGFMFKDSELLGLPLRVVFGEREFLKSGLIEVQERKTLEMKKIKPSELLNYIKDFCDRNAV